MTSEAPDCVWLWRDEPHGNLVVSTPSELYPAGSPQYVRADLHQQALEAAREEGRKDGLEEAAKAVEILNGQCVDPHVKVWATNRAEAIRALIDTPADPVAEAARVLLSSGMRNIAPLVLNAVEDERVKWEESQAMRQGHVPPETITLAMFEACLRALAQKEGE